jgi:hypothetical protein
MYSEAINGNVQAGRLILEHSGKLVKNVEVKVESPFERFLQGSKKIENAIEVVEEEEKLLEEQKESPTEKLNKQKSDSKKLLSRAKKVGLKPLGPGRHTKTKRKEWLLELEKLEIESA